MILRRLRGFSDDVLAAVEYYVQFDKRLGLRFIGGVKEVISLLEFYPEGRPVLFDQGGVKIRRVRIKGFPYAIYFSYDRTSDTLSLYAVMCERRDPNAIRRVMRGRRRV